MTTVFERLHTIKCSGFFGSNRTALTAKSFPNVLKVAEHSVVFNDQILTVPSDEPLYENRVKLMSIHTVRS